MLIVQAFHTHVAPPFSAKLIGPADTELDIELLPVRSLCAKAQGCYQIH